MKVIVFGGNGQLGQCLQKHVNGSSEYVFLSSKDCDLVDNYKLKNVFEQYKPDIVVNCAAYTAVDKAEDEVDLAYAINSSAAKVLAVLCNEHGAKLIHISTDFVFEGNQVGLLNEDNICAPLGVYGASKLEGEKNIRGTLKEHIIIRTSWLYSEYGNNFVKTMLRLAENRKEIAVVSDQVGTPTYAMDLAKLIVYIIGTRNDAYGIYHYSNMGMASWYDFAHAIFDLGGKEVLVNPIKTSEYPTKAKRPYYSVLDKSKIREIFDINILHWRDSLDNCLQVLLREN